MRVFESKRISTGRPDSRLKFEVEPARISERFLLIDGKRVYNLGINCQTCSLLFERLPAAVHSIEIARTAEALRTGVRSLSDDVVDSVGLGLPQSHYDVLLAECDVTMVRPGDRGDYFCEEQIALWGEDNFWCLPHDPRIPYFRAGEVDLGSQRRLFNFVVPMYPTRWIAMRTSWEREIGEWGGGTAVALSILDVRSPADFNGPSPVHPDLLEHWCFTHYLIDGHHKLHTAHTNGTPLRLLSFIALAQCVAAPDEVTHAIDLMRA